MGNRGRGFFVGCQHFVFDNASISSWIYVYICVEFKTRLLLSIDPAHGFDSDRVSFGNHPVRLGDHPSRLGREDSVGRGVCC